MFEELKGKNVLFITTKNLDYLRNTQEIRLLRSQAATVDVLGAEDKSYPKRLIKTFSRLFFTRCSRYDAVFVGFSPQLVVPFFGWKFKKPQLYIDFFISMYDTFAFDRKKVREDSLLGKIFLRLDRKTLQRADRIVADTKAHARYFCEDLGADPAKMQVLYLEADQGIYKPHEVEKPQEAQGKYTVLYFGSILPLQGVDVVLEAAGKLADREDICFYIIGPIGNSMEKPQEANIHYIEWLPQKELSDYIACSDLCLAGHFNQNINKAKRTIPGKAYIYEAMKKPMILGDNPATRERYCPEMEDIFFVEMGNAGKLSEMIAELSEREK